MGERDVKWTRSMAKASLADLLRQLAAWSESGEDRDGLPPIREVRGLKLRVEDEGEGFSVKLKVKRRADKSGAGSKPKTKQEMSYKAVKKKLKADMKALAWYASECRLPTQNDVAHILANAEMATRFPGRGEDYYAPFLAALGNLRKALAESDIDLFTAAVEELERVKKECHAKHK